MIAIVNFAARLLMLFILLRVVVSWMRPPRENRCLYLLRILTEPVLAPFRRFFNLRRLGFDLSPLAALISVEILRNMVIWIVRAISL